MPTNSAITTSTTQRKPPAAPRGTTPVPANGSAVQLKASLQGLDYHAQSAKLAPPDEGAPIQMRAVQRKSVTAGADLMAVQDKLNQLGFDCGVPDGVLGSQTRAAIMAFQESRGLAVDGVCGPATLAALDQAAGSGGGPPAGGAAETQPAPTVPNPTAGGGTTPDQQPVGNPTGGTGGTTPEAPAAGGKPAYLSQRDNASDQGGGGDVQCSPTSFAMQLINVYKGDAEAVKTRARAILVERGEKSDYDQVEDLLIEILQTTDWKAATSEKPSFFWSPKTWASWAAEKYGGIYYKDPNAQQYVASLFDGVGNSAAQTYAQLYTFKDWAPIIDALKGGAAVTAEGAFTSSGHVVSIISADADGVVINDPYGLYVEEGYYLRNGEAPRVSLASSGMAALTRRAKLRSDVMPAYDEARALPNWGESNSYSWADVDKVKIGKWFSVLNGA